MNDHTEDTTTASSHIARTIAAATDGLEPHDAARRLSALLDDAVRADVDEETLSIIADTMIVAHREADRIDAEDNRV